MSNPMSIICVRTKERNFFSPGQQVSVDTVASSLACFLQCRVGANTTELLGLYLAKRASGWASGAGKHASGPLKPCPKVLLVCALWGGGHYNCLHSFP